MFFDPHSLVFYFSGKSQFYKSCSHFSAYDIVADRVQFANASQTLLKERYLHLHALINGLQINNIGRPGEYNEAQQKKETVRENIQVSRDVMLKSFQAWITALLVC